MPIINGNEMQLVALRAYMEQTFGPLRPDRSTEDYALEFLRTERANLLHLEARLELSMGIGPLLRAVESLHEAITRAEKLFQRADQLREEK